MDKVTRACLTIIALLAFARFVSAQEFYLFNVHGRYVSTENAFDTSSVHAVTAQSSLVGSPIFFATAEVMLADGKGNVCGEVDGFYSGIDAPGVDLGPAYFYGTYTVGLHDGRVVITKWSTTGYCVPAPNPGLLSSTVQVGYLQDQGAGNTGATRIVTVDQVYPGTDPDSTGFLVHTHVWTKTFVVEPLEYVVPDGAAVKPE
jgi:hypothetical protein